jgi:hypothetical protein
MTEKYKLSPAAVHALSDLSDRLQKMRVALLSDLVAAATEQLSAEREKRQSRNNLSLRSVTEQMFQAEDLSRDLDLLCNRVPQANQLNNSVEFELFDRILKHNTHYPNLRNIEWIEEVVDKGAINAELTALLGAQHSANRHADRAKRSKGGGWFRGLGGSREESSSSE